MRLGRTRPLLIASASAFCLTWTTAAIGQPVEPPQVVPTVEPASEAAIAAPTPPPPDFAFPEVAPIISDEEFEKAIPQISVEDDPELSRPLESIADFEKRQAADASKTADTAADAATPTSSSLTASAGGGSSTFCLGYNAGHGAATLGYRRVVTPNRLRKPFAKLRVGS